MRSYEAARTYFSILSFVSWAIIILGGLVAFLAIAAIGQMSRGYGGSSMAGLAGILPGAAVMFAGFMGLVLSQIGRAGVDTAEYTQQMLKVARDQLEVSRQGLNANGQPAESFAQRLGSETGKTNGFSASGSYEADPKPEAATQAPELADIFIDGSDRGHYKGVEMRKKGKMLVVEDTSFLTLERAIQFIDEKQA